MMKRLLAIFLFGSFLVACEREMEGVKTPLGQVLTGGEHSLLVSCERETEGVRHRWARFSQVASIVSWSPVRD